VQHHALPGSVTALRLAEAVVEVNLMAVDWLANFSDDRVTTNHLPKFGYNVFTTILQHRNLLMYDKNITKLRRFYDCRTMFGKLSP